jgi:hypothetical protein
VRQPLGANIKMPDGAESDVQKSLRSNPDFTARGLASEAMAALRSHEKFNELEFKVMQTSHDEIKSLITDLRKDMNSGFKSYDAKFWSLAVTVISLLLGVVGVLIYQVLFHHG